MTNILVVTGSARPNSVNSEVVPVVAEVIEENNSTAIVADLAELNLPFMDSEFPPSHPNFETSHENVKQWTKMVEDADGVIFVTPEYNHTMTPIQLNAIDWVSKQWQEKPVAFVSYVWTACVKLATATANEALAKVLKAKTGEKQVNLFFTKDINTDGSLINEADTKKAIAELVAELASV